MFDMDGTLTEPRKEISDDMIDSLFELSKVANICIVTGSGPEYIYEQLRGLLKVFSALWAGDRLGLMPCNGTEVYQHKSPTPYDDGHKGLLSEGWDLIHKVSMRDAIGNDNYRKIQIACLESQATLMKRFRDLPYTGTFIQHRGSALNWSPIGRNAGDSERKAWVVADEAEGIRKYYLHSLKQKLFKQHVEGVEIALGGSTSFDIFPEGWDKTYGLRYLENTTFGPTFSFVGDKCKYPGNDASLYRAVKKRGLALETESVEQTIEMINSKLIPFFESKS